MNKEELNQRFDTVTRTILDGIDIMHKDLIEKGQRDKLEIFNKIDLETGKLCDELASKETVRDHEIRIKKLEEQIV